MKVDEKSIMDLGTMQKDPDRPFGHYLESNYLITKANEMLDDFKFTEDKRELKRRTEELLRIKQSMIVMGFNAPFMGLLLRLRQEMDFAEDEDLKKQVEALTTIANMKKYSLARTRISLSAHKLALELLETTSELPSHLPFDGSYLATLLKTGTRGIYAYNELMELLEGNEEKYVISVLVEFERNNSKQSAILEFEQGYKKIQESIRSRFGREAKVVKTKMKRKKACIIKKRSVRICLALSCVLNSYSKNRDKFREDAKKILCMELLRQMLKPKREKSMLKINPCVKEDLKIFESLHKNLSSALWTKYQHEALQGQLKMPSEIFTSSIIFLHSSIPLSWFSENFGLKEEDILEGAKTLVNIVGGTDEKIKELGGKQERVKKFLEEALK